MCIVVLLVAVFLTSGIFQRGVTTFVPYSFSVGLSVPDIIQMRMKEVCDRLFFLEDSFFSRTIPESYIELLLNLRIELLEITQARNYASVLTSHRRVLLGIS